jgi:transcriptional regulator GlxA family with amidase domain
MFRVLGRISLRPFVYLAAILLLPLLAGGINAGIKYSALSPIRAVPSVTNPLPPPPAYDPTKKIAVVVASDYGAEVTDFLPTYDILARSGRFNVYVVAPDRRVIPLVGFSSTGLNVVPQFSFAGYQVAIGRAPDLIAVPWLPNYTASRDAAVLRWLRSEAGPRTTVLGICSGTSIVADAGLLDGHRATTNTGLFARMEQQHPSVRWIHNVRYVDDGPVLTSTNLASGMDATLHVVDRFAGRAVALAVTRQIGYPTTRYLDDARWQPFDYTAALGIVMTNATFRAGWERLGLVLHPGVDELSLAAWADPYTGSLAGQAYSVAQAQAPVRSQHGLYFVPDYTFATAPHFDRLLVPDGSAGRWPYTASLRDLAHDQGDAVATAEIQLLFLATASGQNTTIGFPFAVLARVLALSVLGAGLVYALGFLRRRARRHGSPARASRARRVTGQVARFALHFVEMAVAMYVGMMALGALNAQVLVPFAHLDLTGPTRETQVLAMGVFMAAPMVAWMRVRGHGLRHGLEMAAAMMVPFAGVVALQWAGLLAEADMMGVGSNVMWLAMVGVMLLRWNHYAGAPHAHAHGTPAAPPATLVATN